ncbi:MAG: beta-ketoacyl-[acyl-carrier-protein] synthase family protein [Myxococcota bacterium]
MSEEERVVITGIGAVTPNGLDWPTTWKSVQAGDSGIRRIERFDTGRYPVQIAGEIRDFDPLVHLSRKQARRADRMAQLALVAAHEAVHAARIDPGGEWADDTGVLIGCGSGGIETYSRQKEVLDRRGPHALSPLLIPMITVDAAAVQVAIQLAVRGPSLGVASACSTSTDALGLALAAIRSGQARIMIAGGTEAAVTPLGIGGFDRLRALSRRNDEPEAASRPFDAARDGFVLSEGAVVLVLESLAVARSRGATPLAEILSYAATSDGGHLTAPDDLAEGAVRCLARATERAGLAPADVGLLCAHATGTPLGDPVEALAIQRSFGEHTPHLPVFAPKGATGHLLGAAGALSVALCCEALRHGSIPPTRNLEHPEGPPLDHVTGCARPTDARIALAPSYGFGGHNSCLAIARWDG